MYLDLDICTRKQDKKILRKYFCSVPAVRAIKQSNVHDYRENHTDSANNVHMEPIHFTKIPYKEH